MQAPFRGRGEVKLTGPLMVRRAEKAAMMAVDRMLHPGADDLDEAWAEGILEACDFIVWNEPEVEE